MPSKWKIENRISEKQFIEICNRSKSMSKAAAELGLHFNSFKKRALELKCYRPNQAGIGIRKNVPKIPIEDIIVHAKHPQYQSYKLKRRLFEENIKEPKCEECSLSSWQNKRISFELHHIDGNGKNHLLSNLKILCPNCHSQTKNFRGKNIKK